MEIKCCLEETNVVVNSLNIDWRFPPLKFVASYCIIQKESCNLAIIQYS